MGLFSFLKNAGSKLLSNKATGNDAAVKVDSTTASTDALKNSVKKSRETVLESIVKGSGIVVENLSIDLNDDAVTVYGQVETTSLKEKIVLMLGNVDGISTVDDRLSVVATEPESVFYTVVKGDTLSKIAKAQYGDMMKFNIIFEANKPMLTSPDLIYPGQVLRIPSLG